MHRAYRIVWNSAIGVWQVVSEAARGRSKGSSKRSISTLVALTAVGVLSGGALARTLPSAGQIVAGQGSISTVGSAMTVNQTTVKMTIDWQSFSIGAHAIRHRVDARLSEVVSVRQSANPSSTLITAPLMNPDLSEASSMSRPSRSSGLPRRLRGVMAISFFPASVSQWCSFNSVLM